MQEEKTYNENAAIYIACDNVEEYHVIKADGKEVLTHCYNECKKSALDMAELKDKAIKQFFIEHCCPDIEVETNNDGEPLAESFIKAQERRIELAEEMFAQFKKFEERIVK